MKPGRRIFFEDGYEARSRQVKLQILGVAAIGWCSYTRFVGRSDFMGSNSAKVHFSAMRAILIF